MAVSRRWFAVGVAALFAVVAACSSASDTLSTEKKKSTVASSGGTVASSGSDSEGSTQATSVDRKVEIIEQGFAVLPASSEYDQPDATAAAIIRNPTDRIALSVDVSITFLDAGGGVLQSTSKLIAALAPGTTTGVSAMEMGLTEVASIQVQARASGWEEVRGEIGALTVSGVNLRTEEIGGIPFSTDVNGVVNSTAGQDLDDVKVEIIFRDANAVPVAGTFTFVDFVPAAGSSPFTTAFGLGPNVVPADWTAEGYAVPSSMTLMAGSN